MFFCGRTFSSVCSVRKPSSAQKQGPPFLVDRKTCNDLPLNCRNHHALRASRLEAPRTCHHSVRFISCFSASGQPRSSRVVVNRFACAGASCSCLLGQRLAGRPTPRSDLQPGSGPRTGRQQAHRRVRCCGTRSFAAAGFVGKGEEGQQGPAEPCDAYKCYLQAAPSPPRSDLGLHSALQRFALPAGVEFL